MLSDVDIYRAAHLMMHEYGNNAEREAARCADRMLGRGDREELLNWFRIGRTIAVMRQAPTGLSNGPQRGIHRTALMPWYGRSANCWSSR